MKRLLGLFALLLATPLWGAVQCDDATYKGQSYTICRVDMQNADLRLFLQRPEGGPYASFAAIDETLSKLDKHLGFAMNAGMYHRDRSPVGLYIEEHKERAPLITQPGPGNFGMLPNGVFCIAQKRADVIETLSFEPRTATCNYATQSGPMLVIDGALHPRFLKDSTSRYIRNGVGTSEDGRWAVFAISNTPVTFYEFASFFKEHLGLPNALYLDGSISRLHAPGLGRSDIGFAMGPIVGVVAPAP
jgi:uncharacterized protein YigE (DUF2233 family)